MKNSVPVTLVTPVTPVIVVIGITWVTGVTGVTCEQVGVFVYQVVTRCDQSWPVGNFLTMELLNASKLYQ